jgi:hypothetical protein
MSKQRKKQSVQATVCLSHNLHASGRVYPEVFQKLAEKAAKEGLLVEFGTPRLPETAHANERLDRYRHVDRSRVCARITDIWTEGDQVVMGKIQTEGPMAQFVENAINSNGGDNLRFSVRSMVKGNNEIELFTYDLVNYG